jgi:hypothetical protein
MALCYDHRQQLFHDAGEFYHRWEERDPPPTAA